MLLIASFAALISCTHIPIYDKEVCADLGAEGAHCHNTYIDKSRDIPKSLWDKERVGYFCMDSTAYTDAEVEIEQLCTVTKLCDYRTREQLNNLKKKLMHLYQKAQAARRKEILSRE